MNIKEAVTLFLRHCQFERELSLHTLKAYELDLIQFQKESSGVRATTSVSLIQKDEIRQYLIVLHSKYKPRSIKRKIATLKAFFSFLEAEDLIDTSPFRKMRLKLDKARSLPRIIPSESLSKLLQAAYSEISMHAEGTKAQRESIRDVAVLEMLFATGGRVSEICMLQGHDVDLRNESVRIMGKGKRERIVPICSQETMQALMRYEDTFSSWLEDGGPFFLNRDKRRFSDQSVRRIIRKYQKIAGIQGQITPHMFRHTVATMLLENGADIRNIQQFLGHSSLVVTEIYTHVSPHSQKKILSVIHPGNMIRRGGINN